MMNVENYLFELGFEDEEQEEMLGIFELMEVDLILKYVVLDLMWINWIDFLNDDEDQICLI